MVNNMRKKFLLFLFAIPATAFAAHPRNLMAIEAGRSFVLHEDFVETEKAATFTLKAGEYVERFTDREGAYLIGSENCLELHVTPKKNPDASYTMRFDCGVYYPNDNTTQPRFFYIRQKIPYMPEAGLLINYIIKHGEGGFLYPLSKDHIIDLRSRLKISAADSSEAD